MQIPTYKQQSVTPQPIDRVMEQPNLAKEQRLAAWGDVVSNGLPKAAMAVDEAYQKEQDFKFGLYKDQANDAAKGVLDQVQAKMESEDPVKLYFSEDPYDIDVEFQNAMQEARENNTKDLKGGMKRRADRYWDALTSANTAVARELYAKNKKVAGAIIVGQRASEAEQKAINAPDDMAYAEAMRDIEEAIDEGVRIGAILPKDRDSELAEAQKRVFEGQTNAILQKRGEAYNSLYLGIFNGTTTEKDILENPYLGMMPERKINSDLKKTLIDILQDHRKEQAKAQADADKIQADRTMINEAMNVIQGASPAAGKAYIAGIRASDLDKDTKQAINDFYTDYWAAKKIEISNTQGDYYFDVRKKIDSGEISNREQIELDPNLEDWSEIGVPKYKKDLLNYFDKTSKGSTSSSSKGNKDAVSTTAPEDVADLTMNLFSIYRSKESREEKLRDFAHRHPEFVSTKEYQDLAKAINGNGLPIDPEIQELSEMFLGEINRFRDKGDDDSVKELTNAYNAFFNTLANDMWYSTDVKGEKVYTSAIERANIMKNAKAVLKDQIMKKGLKSILDYHDTTNPAKFVPDSKGGKYGYILDGEDKQYDKIKEDCMTGLHLLGGIAADTNEVQKKYEKRYMIQAGIPASELSNYNYTYIQNEDGNGGNMYFVSPDKATLYYIAKNDRGYLNIFKGDRIGGEDSTKYDIHTVIPTTIENVADAKADRDANKEPWNPQGGAVRALGTGTLDIEEVKEQGREQTEKMKNAAMPWSEVSRKIVEAGRGTNKKEGK